MTEPIFYIIVAMAFVSAVWAIAAFILFHLGESSQHLPHQYSTENSHEVTSGKSCICPVANCSICGEGR